MRLISVIIMSLGCAVPRNVMKGSIRKWIHTLSVPWVGLLSHKVKNSKEALAGIILINTKLAMGNAYEVSIINKRHIRKTTKAMFLTEDGVVYCAVTDYILHPEFDEVTLNTIALLKLEYNETKFQWQLMDWPMYDSQMNEHSGEVYLLGYTDRHKALEQVMHKMEFVNLSDCRAFYKKEQLDNHWMAPTEFQCFRRKLSREQCVIDSGMALAVQSEGKWTLLGMSILGPGCSLPSRFLDFARFVPWVQPRNQGARRDLLESQIHWPNYDKVIFEKLNDESMVMRPYNGTEVIHGTCNKTEGVMMYKEEGSFQVPYYGIGIYGLSIWDKVYRNITCVLLTVKCTKRSTKPFSFNFGLLQYDEDLAGMTKVIPIPKPLNQTLGPKTVHLKDGPWLKWFYRPRDYAKVSSVVFRFEFYQEATLKILFYGTEIPHVEPKKPPSSTTPEPKKRSRRPHSHHSWGYKGL